MSIPVLSAPPPERTNYIIEQLEGERITIPGSQGTFRILASSKQTNGAIAVFQSAAVLSDAPGFHWHAEAHDVFLVTKGFIKLWNGDKCRILGPGDFSYIPPKIIHNPEMLGPHTEQLGLIAPGDWVDFFRYISEEYNGVVLPELDDRDLRGILIPKVMAAKDRYDVNFVHDYEPPALGEWLDTENVLPGPLEPYFLRSNTGPRWIPGGVISRPFIMVAQTEGKFAISSIEGSSAYGTDDSQPLKRWLTFPTVDHMFAVQEGLLKVRLQGEAQWTAVREGQTLIMAAGHAFALEFASRYVRAISFTSGSGIEELVQTAGAPLTAFVLPEKVVPWAETSLYEAARKLGVKLGGKA